MNDDNSKTADALEHFLNITDQFPLAGISYQIGNYQAPKIILGGVEISVRPDIILTGRYGGRDIVGGIKFHYTVDENKALGDQGGKYVATLVRQWLVEHGPQDRHAHQNFCYSVGVFQEQVIVAPAAYDRLIQQMQAACEEISLRWDAITYRKIMRQRPG